MASKAGFYKRDGEELLFSGSSVTLSNGAILDVKNRQDYSFPVEGWSYYSSKKEALKADMSPPVNTEPKVLSRKEEVMARLQTVAAKKELELNQRENERLVRIERERPGLARRIKQRSRASVAGQFHWPQNPERFQTVKTPDGTLWRFDQPRDPDGTFSTDDPSTLKIESAMRWIPIS